MTWVKWFYFLVIVWWFTLWPDFMGNRLNQWLPCCLFWALLLHYTVPKDEVRLLKSFYARLAKSRIVYQIKTIDYFPLLVRDSDGDGRAGDYHLWPSRGIEAVI